MYYIILTPHDPRNPRYYGGEKKPIVKTIKAARAYQSQHECVRSIRALETAKAVEGHPLNGCGLEQFKDTAQKVDIKKPMTTRLQMFAEAQRRANFDKTRWALAYMPTAPKNKWGICQLRQVPAGATVAAEIWPQSAWVVVQKLSDGSPWQNTDPDAGVLDLFRANVRWSRFIADPARAGVKFAVVMADRESMTFHLPDHASMRASFTASALPANVDAVDAEDDDEPDRAADDAQASAPARPARPARRPARRATAAGTVAAAAGAPPTNPPAATAPATPAPAAPAAPRRRRSTTPTPVPQSGFSAE